MNGHYTKDGSITILERHNNLLTDYSFEQIILNTNKELDHRKMMCFFTMKNVGKGMVTSSNSLKTISLKDINTFLDSIYIGGILIGSSNQSNSSYFQAIASKGESDIFMFDDSEDAEDAEISGIMDILQSVQQYADYPKNLEDVVLTKSFHGTGHKDTQSFFKEILRNILESGLNS